MQICSSCHAGCCRKHNIDVTGFDILNIVEALDLDISFFTEAIPTEEQYAKSMIGKVPLFKFSDGDSRTFYRMSLKMRGSVLFPDTLKCMLLQEWKDDNENSPDFGKIIARCGIYGIRPLTCSTYPAKLDPNSLSAYYVDPTSGSKNEENPAYKTCPKSLTQDDFAGESKEAMKNLVLYKYELDFFKMLSAKWNKNPRSSDDLMAYLQEEYKNRVKFRPNQVSL